MSYSYNSVEDLRYVTDKLSCYSTSNRCKSLSDIYIKIIESKVLDEIIDDYKKFTSNIEYFADEEYEKLLILYPKELVVTVHSMIPEVIDVYNSKGSIEKYKNNVKKLSVDFAKAAETLSDQLDNDDRSNIFFDNFLKNNLNSNIDEIKFSITKAKGFLKIIDDLDRINHDICMYEQSNYDLNIKNLRNHYIECKEYDLFFTTNFNRASLLDDLIDYKLISEKEYLIESSLNKYDDFELVGSSNINYIE